MDLFPRQYGGGPEPLQEDYSENSERTENSAKTDFQADCCAGPDARCPAAAWMEQEEASGFDSL